MMASYFQMNTASSSGSLPSNTIRNPQANLKAITTRSGVTLDGPSVSPLHSKEVDQELETITNQSGSPTLASDPKIASYSPSFTHFVGSDFILEEIETFLQTPDELSDLDDDYYDTEGDILYLEKLLNEDPSPNLPPVKTEDHKQVNATMTKPSIDKPLDLKLKELPSHLEYAFLEGTNKLPVIIFEELKDEEKSALLKVLKSHKWAIASWVSLVHCVPKKNGNTVVENKDNWLIPTRMGFLDIFRSRLTHKTKKRLPLLALMERLLTDKCHFMVKEGIVLGHKISKSEIKVDRAKIDVIAKLPHLTSVKDAKPRLIQWILLLQEFDVIIRNKKRAENLAADHLSILENPHQDELENKEITKTFPLDALGMIAFRDDSSTQWYADFCKLPCREFYCERDVIPAKE
nr:reverse transcriptase domain-containing protein [Tanacetum cinerariifolium]